MTQYNAPWKLVSPSQVVDADGRSVALVNNGTERAALVSAAPEMLEALESIMSKIELGGGNYHDRDAWIAAVSDAEFAIKKAKWR